MNKTILAAALTIAALAPIPASADFSGDYAPANWTTTLTGFPEGGGAPAGTTHTAATLTLTGGEESCSTVTVIDCMVQRTIVSVADVLKFHWEFNTQDLFGAGSDPFGYIVNSTLFQLTDDFGLDSQSGDAIVHLNPGDVFGFYVNCGFCDLGNAVAVVSDFRVPEPASLALFGLALAGLSFARRRS